MASSHPVSAPLVPFGLAPSRLAAAAIRLVRVHRCWQGEVQGRPVWFKRRRLGMSGVIAVGNLFFRSARAQIAMISRIHRWLEHELSHWRLLYGEHSCGRRDARTLWTQALPGRPLSHHLAERGQAVAVFEAAGVALVGLHARLSGGSHGDLHIDNVLYDPRSQEAHIIDFDTLSLCKGEALRQGEDLAIFLLDLYRRVPEAARRAELADAFLAAGHRREVLSGCQQRLSDILDADHFLGRVMRQLRIGQADPLSIRHELLARLARL